MFNNFVISFFNISKLLQFVGRDDKNLFLSFIKRFQSFYLRFKLLGYFFSLIHNSWYQECLFVIFCIYFMILNSAWDCLNLKWICWAELLDGRNAENGIVKIFSHKTIVMWSGGHLLNSVERNLNSKSWDFWNIENV